MKKLKDDVKNSNFIKNMMKNSEEPKSKKIRRSHIPLRLNLLFLIIFALFAALIVKMGDLQIVNGDYYQEKINSVSQQTIEGNAPRGMIYDSSGTPLVTNKGNQAITFTRNKDVQAHDILELAIKLNELIDMPADDLTERDKKDFFLANTDHLQAVDERLTDAERKDAKGNQLSDSELYPILVDKVTAEEIAFDEPTMKIATIFKRMNSAVQNTTVFVKNTDVTDQEIAVVGEHTSELPGISTGTDWVREQTENIALGNIIGTVSSEKSGLPAEEAEEYLKKGYAMNDRVGTSYLEKAYEEDLQGVKSKSQITFDNKGKIVSQEVISEGEKGKNVKLTINLEFQQKVEEIVRRNYQALVDNGKAKYSNGIYAVVTDPNTGGILAMVGFDHEEGSSELTDNALGTYQSVVVPGSVVKGATLTAGYETGVITGNDVLIDEPIQIQGSQPKASYFNRSGQIPTSAEKALEWSSNSYMMKLVLKMLGTDYAVNMGIPYDTSVFEKLRHGFAQYGLGVETEIDLPNESAGLVSTDYSGDDIMGKALDLSYGQYDNYTAMQLAQYAATVANGGKRIAPHVVEGVYNNDENGNLGELDRKIETEVLNTVDITEEQMNIIRTGFYNVVHGTDSATTATQLKAAKMDVSAKTGTAEIPGSDGTMMVNSNIVAYGPSDAPKVSLSVVIPKLIDENDGANKRIALEILDTYYDMFIQGQ